MLSTTAILISTTLVGYSSFYMYNVHAADCVKLKKIFNGEIDNFNKIHLERSTLKGSNHVFSLNSSTAIYNELKVYRDKFVEETDVNPVFMSKGGVGFTFTNKMTRVDDKVFSKTWIANKMVCRTQFTYGNTDNHSSVTNSNSNSNSLINMHSDRILDHENAKIFFNNSIKNAITIANMNKLIEETQGELPLNLTCYKETVMSDNDKVLCLIKNDNIEALAYDEETLKTYVTKHYYPWSDDLLWTGTIIVIAIVLLVAVFIVES